MIRPLSPAEIAAAPAGMRRAAQEFETQALARLLQPALAAAGAGRGAFGGGAAEAQWQPMLADAIAATAVRAGRGIGLSDMVLREMLRRQAASRTEETTE